MSSLSPIAAPGQTRRRGPVETLRAWLWDNHYSPHAADRIVAHAEAEGTVSGCPYLDREDEAAASEVYAEAFEPVGRTSPAWGNASDAPSPLDPLDDIWSTVIPPELEVSEDEMIEETIDPHDGESFETAVPVAVGGGIDIVVLPIAGGAPVEVPHFVPTEQDWADYRAHCEREDARLRAAGRDPLHGFE